VNAPKRLRDRRDKATVRLMPSKMKKAGLRLRVFLDPDIAVGPGKAEILEGIRETGSIAAAGRRMNMSYKRAWLLVDTMNACFREPLVETSRGGRSQGGARLTETGEQVLAHYRRMEAKAAEAVEEEMREMRALLRDMSEQK
jgi:molybdate transport system regulatory protein